MWFEKIFQQVDVDPAQWVQSRVSQEGAYASNLANGIHQNVKRHFLHHSPISCLII
jgi:hypothetical protein